MKQNQEPLAIVVVAYNRAKALQTLLQSLNGIISDCEVPLIISIDGGGTPEVNEIAKNYSWHLGEKHVVVHEKLGLIKHFIWAGDQSLTYGNILFLEDDLSVAPDIVNYAQQLISFYKGDDRVTGGSCYNMMYTFTGMHFFKIEDGFDNYFWQHPYWGNVWFGERWADFKRYLETYQEKNVLLPVAVQIWQRSFKKIYLQFLAETNKTMVFPRVSLVTNNGIGGGEHFDSDTSVFQVPMSINVGKKYHFASYDESISKYDLFEEIYAEVLKNTNKDLSKFDFIIDTKLNRNYYDKEFVLTSYKTKKSIIQYQYGLKPVEYAALYSCEGNGLVLAKTSDICKQSGREILTKDMLNNMSNTSTRDTFPLFVDSLRNSLKAKLSFFRMKNK